MTPLDLKQLREAAERATPGPWSAEIGVKFTWVDAPELKSWICDTRKPENARALAFRDEEEANAAFIALWNPQAALALLDRLEEAEREREASMETIAYERQRAETTEARIAELEEERDAATAMLDRYEAPLNDEGYDGGPLSVAGRIEAMVYRDAIRGDIAYRTLRYLVTVGQPTASGGMLIDLDPGETEDLRARSLLSTTHQGEKAGE